LLFVALFSGSVFVSNQLSIETSCFTSSTHLMEQKIDAITREIDELKDETKTLKSGNPTGYMKGILDEC